jgi:hypothetical protein
MGQKVEAQPDELGKQKIKDSMFEDIDGVIQKPRAEMVELPVAERICNFEEVDQILTESAALAESKRCLFCGITCYNPDAESTREELPKAA